MSRPERQEVAMSGHEARVLLGLVPDARGWPFRIHEVRIAPVTARLLLESGSTQARGLEGRPLAMYFSLMLPDRSRLRTSPLSSRAKETE